jgi:hypothetical protein
VVDQKKKILGDSMISQDSYDYIQIGLTLRLLRNVVKGNSAMLAKRTIKTFLESIKKARFEVTQAALKSSSYKAMEGQVNGMDDKDPLSEELVKEISSEFQKLESIVFAEAMTKRVYMLPARRYSTEYLLVSPSQLLKDGVFGKLNEIARSDFESSCRCILFGEATASAFHIIRATESVLKDYYYTHRKRNRLEKPMWGPMIDQLRAKKKGAPPASLLAALDNIRVTYRNPTQHPEALYTIDGAQDLFGVCSDVIGKMCDELPSSGA